MSEGHIWIYGGLTLSTEVFGSADMCSALGVATLAARQSKQAGDYFDTIHRLLSPLVSLIMKRLE